MTSAPATSDAARRAHPARPTAPARWTRPRLFATPAQMPRARRATDALLLGVAALGLALVSVAAVPDPAFSNALATLLQSLPPVITGVWQLLLDLLTLWAVVLVVGAAVARRPQLARDLVLAAALAVVVDLLVGRSVTGSWPKVWDGLRAAAAPPWYPSARLTVAGAVVIAASPHVSRPVRRVGRWLVALAAVGLVALGASTPLGVVAGLLVATMAAAAVHLALGSSAGRPGLDDVQAALAELGIPVRRLGAADRQPAGLFLVTAEDEEGRPLVVKVYGRDAHDSALVSTLWRTLWYREPGAPIRLGRLRQVEHEAFITLLAAQRELATDTVVTAGATAQDDALLVLRPLGPALAELRPPPDPAALVPQVWDLVHQLHRAGLTHGQLDDQHLVPWGDRLGLRDFRGATLAAAEAQERTDEVQALVATMALAGEEVAVAQARQALGADGLAAVLPFLQAPVVTVRQRRWLRAADIDLDDLRARAAAVAGTEEPTLQRLQRITLGSIVRVLLPAVAVLALVSGLAGLDYDLLLQELREASWLLVAIGFFVAQTPRLTQSVSTLGASPVPLALGPVYALQLAVSYINLAIPSAAARIAVNIRFFQRHGVPAGSALAVGALDGFISFFVQAVLLAVFLLFGSASLDLSVGESGSSVGGLVVLVVAIAVVAVVAVLARRRWRTFVLGWARRLLHEAVAAVRGLRSPRRLALLLGGSVGTEVLFAFSLGVFVRALGWSVGLDELLFINITVSLLAGLLPVPGGIGVTEGGLVLGLVRAGVPEEVAFAAVLLYRLATFYLPPIWGFFALRWLERGKHL